jgi:hypothetical protein
VKRRVQHSHKHTEADEVHVDCQRRARNRFAGAGGGDEVKDREGTKRERQARRSRGVAEGR